MKKLHTLMFSVGLLAGASAQAQLKIEIAGVGSNQIPIAIAAFADESMAPAQVSSIIKADLERSGVFKIIDAGTINTALPSTSLPSPGGDHRPRSHPRGQRRPGSHGGAGRVRGRSCHTRRGRNRIMMMLRELK